MAWVTLSNFHNPEVRVFIIFRRKYYAYLYAIVESCQNPGILQTVEGYYVPTFTYCTYVLSTWIINKKHINKWTQTKIIVWRDICFCDHIFGRCGGSYNQNYRKPVYGWGSWWGLVGPRPKVPETHFCTKSLCDLTNFLFNFGTFLWDRPSRWKSVQLDA